MIVAATKSPEDTRELAAAVAGLIKSGDIVLLAGDLGAGKTTFAQGFGRALGIEEPITSPTFTLMRPYQGRLRLLHCDVYRLDRLQEILDLGITELVDDESVALVEWGDRAEPVLPPDFLEIEITYGSSEEERGLTLRWVGTAWSARSPALQRALERWSSTP